MRLRGDESRILANFRPSFGEVSTLAHELGHAYHNLNLARAPAAARHADDAGRDGQHLLRDDRPRGRAAQRRRQEQLPILEASLQGACQVVVDITSRFLFEQRVFERRQQRELSVDEFNALMLDAQRETYGDGLDARRAAPLHVGGQGPLLQPAPFYNYPYMFGLLFGLGLYARYQAEPEAFKAGYDDLLSPTGLADAATLAARFGIDLRSIDFWRASLDVIRTDIDRFEALITGPLMAAGNAAPA